MSSLLERPPRCPFCGRLGERPAPSRGVVEVEVDCAECAAAYWVSVAEVAPPSTDATEALMRELAATRVERDCWMSLARQWRTVSGGREVKDE
jgi:hypothetical protein